MRHLRKLPILLAVLPPSALVVATLEISEAAPAELFAPPLEISEAAAALEISEAAPVAYDFHYQARYSNLCDSFGHATARVRLADSHEMEEVEAEGVMDNYWALLLRASCVSFCRPKLGRS